MAPLLQHRDTLSIDLSLNNFGLHLSMSDQGNPVATMLFHCSRPARQINDFLMQAIKPIMATFGPWSSGQGFKDCLKVHVDVYCNNDSFVITAGHQITRDNEECLFVVQTWSTADEVSSVSRPALLQANSSSLVLPPSDASMPDGSASSHRGKV